MSKTSNPVHDGLGIVARLVVIAMLLVVLSFVLQGCSQRGTDTPDAESGKSISIVTERAPEAVLIALH